MAREEGEEKRDVFSITNALILVAWQLGGPSVRTAKPPIRSFYLTDKPLSHTKE